MTDRELMQQALEALDWAADCIEPRKPHNCDCPVCVASDALRERLAQDKVECSRCGRTLADLPDPNQCPPCNGNCRQGRECPSIKNS